MIAVQVVVAAAGLVALYRLGSEYIEQRRAALAVGDRLPAAVRIDASGREPTLLVAIRSGCEFVERDMPFYAKLARLRSRGAARSAVVVVSPDDDDALRTFLRIHDVDLPRTPNVSLAALKIHGTPTLVLVDEERRITRIWSGSLNPSSETDVLTAIGVPLAAARPADTRSAGDAGSD